MNVVRKINKERQYTQGIAVFCLYTQDETPKGVTDCLALLSSGRKAIAIPGATLLKPEDVKLLASLRVEKRTVFHIFPDKDEAGERLYRRLVHAANDMGACLVRDELPNGFKDFGQWWASQA